MQTTLDKYNILFNELPEAQQDAFVKSFHLMFPDYNSMGAICPEFTINLRHICMLYYHAGLIGGRFI